LAYVPLQGSHRIDNFYSIVLIQYTDIPHTSPTRILKSVRDFFRKAYCPDDKIQRRAQSYENGIGLILELVNSGAFKLTTVQTKRKSCLKV